MWVHERHLLRDRDRCVGLWLMEFALITFCVCFVTSHSCPRLSRLTRDRDTELDFDERELFLTPPMNSPIRVSKTELWRKHISTQFLTAGAALVGRKLCKLAFNYLNNATQLHRHNETAGNSHRPSDKCLQSRVQMSFDDNLINSNGALSLKASPVGASTGPGA